MNMKYLFAFVTALVLSGCSRSTTKTRVLEPVKPDKDRTENTDNKSKVDTIAWTVLSEDEYPPIRSENVVDFNAFAKEIKNITLLVPFDVQNNPASLTRGESKFAHFYAGALLALEELESEGFQATIDVKDTRRNASSLNRLIQNGELENSDVVIGPYEVDNLKRMAQWCRDRQVPMISPWRSSSSIASDNSFYYQVRPLIEQYFEGMIEDALNDHQPEDIYIIGRGDKEDDSKFSGIQRIYETIDEVPIKTPLSEYRINIDSLQDSEQIIFDSLFYKSPRAAMIIPHYSSRDAQFVYSVIRKLSAEMSDQDIAVYGMPTVINSDRMDLQFFRSLKLYSVDYKHLDKNTHEYKKFIDKYFNEYNALPTEDSFDGYDVMILLYNLTEEARLGSSYSERSNALPLLSYSAEFEKYVRARSESGSIVDKYASPDFMVNKSLGRIEFVDNRFRKRPINRMDN